MSRWYLTYFGKVGRSLGHSDAKTEALARKEAIDFYDIPETEQFRVVAVPAPEAKKPRRTKVPMKT